MSTAAANLPAPTKQQLEIIRTALSTSQQVCAQSAELLDEPLRGMFTGLKKQFDDKLAALPPTEQVPAAMDMNWQLQSLYWCLDHLNQMFRTLNQSLSGMKTAQASALVAEIEKQITEGKLFKADGLTAAVDAEVEKRVKAGEFTPKDLVTQMCATAENNGIAKGEAKIRQEIADREALTQKVGERKQGLQAASFPLPKDETLLGGSDDEFATRKTTAEQRIEALKKEGYQLNSDLLGKVWLPEAGYNLFLEAIKEVPGLKNSTDPLAGAGASRKPAGAKATEKPNFIA